MIRLSALPRPYLTLSLAVLGLLGWYLSDRLPDTGNGLSEEVPHVPSYYVRNLQAVSMGTGGIPERQLETRYLVQYLDDETTEMLAPRYHFFRQDTPPWDVVSEQGWLSADGELALLSGRVTIMRPADENAAPFKMVTRNLRIQPDNNYLETDEAVNVKSGQDVIDAIGMQAWMGKTSRIKFLSDVRANYVPR